MSETRETYDTGQGRPDLESVITQRLTFADGSEIIVTVKAPRGELGAAIVSAGVNLLRSGMLPSVLPARLMADYQLTREKAGRLAGVAIKHWREAKNDRPDND